MADPSHDNLEPEEEVDIRFEPIIKLQPVDVKTLEDDEEEVFKMRAKLFRFDKTVEPAEWKERGVGDIRMLKHKNSSRVRILMRRDKVLRICCNHFLTKNMELRPHPQSERAFVWCTFADFADQEPKEEYLAARFQNVESAKSFKSKFVELQQALSDESEDKAGGDTTAESEVTDKMKGLKVKENSADS